MAKFTNMNPEEVVVGKGRANATVRKQLMEVLRDSEAGKIELDPNEKPRTMKRLLSEAAREAGLQVRSSWADEQQRVLYWKQIGGRDGAQRTGTGAVAGAQRTR